MLRCLDCEHSYVEKISHGTLSPFDNVYIPCCDITDRMIDIHGRDRVCKDFKNREARNVKRSL